MGRTTYRDTLLAKRAVSSMRSGEDRTVYLLAFEHGTLVVHAMGQGDHPLACVPLHDGLAGQLVALFFAPEVQAKVMRIAQTEKPPPVKTLEAVPSTLDEALAMLERQIDAAVMAEIRASKD